MKFVLLLACIIAIWLIFGTIIFWLFGWQGQGLFGDTFGALNTLFSGLAMGFLIVAIMMQREELALQREQLSRTVEVQEDSAESLAKQVVMLQLTARVNAYSLLTQAAEGRLARGAAGQAATTAQADIAHRVSQLEDALKQIEEVV